jgi:hypothetical protein
MAENGRGLGASGRKESSRLRRHWPAHRNLEQVKVFAPKCGGRAHAKPNFLSAIRFDYLDASGLGPGCRRSGRGRKLRCIIFGHVRSSERSNKFRRHSAIDWHHNRRSVATTGAGHVTQLRDANYTAQFINDYRLAAQQSY